MGAGDTRDVPDELAKDLIDAGYAEKVGGSAKTESTEKKPAPKKTTKK
jgi:hypothetical protein